MRYVSNNAPTGNLTWMPFTRPYKSSTSLTIGTGAQNITVLSGLNITVGETLRLSSSGDFSKWMQGVVTGYSNTTLSMNITTIGGSGTVNDWIINDNPATTGGGTYY